MSNRLLIRDGVAILPFGPARTDLLCDAGRIVAVAPGMKAPGADVFNARGLTIGPGLIDVHVHGGGGYSFFTHEPEVVSNYGAWAPRNGVTGFLVSTVGRDAGETVDVLSALSPAIASPGPGAEPLGFHLEGPFINPERKGAFHPNMLRPPSRREYAAFSEAAGGLIRQVTLAPELPLALDLVAAVSVSGALPAMGHTDATLQQARAGFEAGIRHVTHLFNAMRPIHHRDGGPIVAALLEERITCELICDGDHLAPETLQLAYRALGPSRTVIVTDNLHLAGTEQTGGTFGGQEISTSGATAKRTDGTIVGSMSTMDQHFRNAVKFLGIDVATAFRICSTNPARVAGAERRKGAVDRGYDADLVLLDRDMAVAATFCRGQLAHCADPARITPGG